MFETSCPPPIWINSFNNWDAVINPSNWGKRSFIDSGVKVPTYVIPLPIDFSKFQYTQHIISDKWTYLAIAVQLLDRKGVMRVAQLFRSNKMPSDTELIIKTIPKKQQVAMEVWMCPQVRLIQKSLPFEEYYSVLTNSHVSVNPSSGEGFAYIVGEAMAVGLCTLMTRYSALEDLLNNDCTVPIEPSAISPSQVFTTGGNDAKIDEEDLLKKMLWTYEHQEESLKMGKLASQWIYDYCNKEHIISDLSSIFDKLVLEIPRYCSLRNNNDDGWVDWQSVERSLM
jgi:glycosyltransferase involved in cell wall biosynthesis